MPRVGTAARTIAGWTMSTIGPSSLGLGSLAGDFPIGSTAQPAPERHSEKPPVAPYFSPAIRIDPVAAVVVWEVLDANTGKVLRQVPSEATVAAYRAQMEGLVQKPAVTAHLHPTEVQPDQVQPSAAPAPQQAVAANHLPAPPAARPVPASGGKIDAAKV